MKELEQLIHKREVEPPLTSFLTYSLPSVIKYRSKKYLFQKVRTQKQQKIAQFSCKTAQFAPELRSFLKKRERFAAKCARFS
ncbi:MAG TPA: hypothetical protein PLL77_13890 [Pyrinomonadaceae bacterium]|nr:hypothetical protein [Pyrinomonadaceae bacterium]